jgi:tetratricopeptide (TPR) repeat protein
MRERTAIVVALWGGILMAGAEARASDTEAERAYRAGKAAPSEKEGRAHFQRGVALARSVLARDPNDPAALLWFTANHAAEALTHGRLYTLKVIPELERTLLHLERVNPTYDHAAAARVLGRLYHKAPSVISIGSNKKAREYLERALARAPAYAGNQAFAAEFYLDQRDCGRARPLAERILASVDPARAGPDATEWVQIARQVIRACR